MSRERPGVLRVVSHVGSRPGFGALPAIAVGIAVVIAGCCSGAADFGSDVPSRRPSAAEAALEARLAGLVNGERAREGRARLAIDPALSRIARAHSAEMAEEEFFAHESCAKGDLALRLHRAGYAVSAARENLARDASVDDAHRRLMSSPGHLENILAIDVDRLGVGVAIDGADRYITQIFVRRAAVRGQ